MRPEFGQRKNIPMITNTYIFKERMQPQPSLSETSEYESTTKTV